jgi:hypothetical protein|tara:strand:+ start:19 stop:228 length:210 start_codon:yes stop_codon:yes gene_type:complete
MKTKKIKRKAQVKSSHYYLFWGVCTVAVVLGQLYVGTGYRVLHGGVQELLNKVDGVLLRAEPYDGPEYL